MDRNDGQERIIGPDEVRALGETDAEFRRGIVMSEETLGSIVDQSIAELRQAQGRNGRAAAQDHRFRTESWTTASRSPKRSGPAVCGQPMSIHARGRERSGFCSARKPRAGRNRAGSHAGRGFRSSPSRGGDGRQHLRQPEPVCSVRWAGHAGDRTECRAIRLIKASSSSISARTSRGGGTISGNSAKPIRITSRSCFRKWRRWISRRHRRAEPGAGAASASGNFGGARRPGTDMEPIGDPQAAALLRELADMGVTPDQAAHEIRRLRTTRQDRRKHGGHR